jgi:hypothetical protein
MASDDIIYLVRRKDKKYIEISSFVDGSKEAVSVYRVYKGNKGIYICNCPGYWRQKVKEDHKHSRIVKLWVENLEEQEGFCFWLDGDDIDYHRFMDEERLRKYVDNSRIK